MVGGKKPASKSPPQNISSLCKDIKYFRCSMHSDHWPLKVKSKIIKIINQINGLEEKKRQFTWSNAPA